MPIKRSRLSAQAVMAFFNPEDYMQDHISEIDINKIRGLILRKLFKGWCNEARNLKHDRQKAGMTLARAMRRTNGPMWAKETTLLTFHMWRRYGAVRRAYRNEEPVPRFSLPFLVQWPKLLQKVSLNEARKKRASDNAKLLVCIRQFRKWRYMMTIDKSEILTPEEMADAHFNERLLGWTFNSWAGFLAEDATNLQIIML